MNTANVLALLLHERVPLGYEIEQSGRECRRLAQEFVAERGLGPEVGVEDLDDLLDAATAWARARGYELLDDEPGPYLTTNERPIDRGEWKPRRSLLQGLKNVRKT
jgi:hypothetical protein